MFIDNSYDDFSLFRQKKKYRKKKSIAKTNGAFLIQF